MFNKVLIYKDNLINNIRQVKSKNRNSKICAMVKANAYGVGAKQVVKTLDAFVDYYGVACFFEAKKIKKFTNKKILIVGALDEKIDTSFSYSCSSLEDVEKLIKLNKQICVHLKVNSGMNRFGFKSEREFKTALSKIKTSNLVFEGLFTHFATSDDYVKKQMNVFFNFIAIAHLYGFKPIIHADNSTVNLNYNHHLDMVRIGFNLYNQNAFSFQPVVKIKTTVVQINDVEKGELVGYDYRFVAKNKLKVAVLPIGYADGFDTHYIGMKITVKGVECEVLNVCMDCFMLDVTKVKLKKGDEVFIVDENNPLIKFARHINSSAYEVMTKFSNIRADRVLV